MSQERECLLGRYLGSTALVGGATAVGFAARGTLDAADLVMLYLVAIMLAAVFWGRGSSVLAATLSVAAYDFFFVPPFFTFTVSHARHFLTFAMMFVVGLLISGLTLRIRRQEHDARDRETRTAALALRARTEEMRSTLLAAVSHDLRTPLAVITGAATTLRDACANVGPDQRRELIDTICEEAERLERLVANLLDMTRLDSGGIEVRREWVPLEEIVGSALTRLESRLAGRAIHTGLPPDLPFVSADPVLLGQVFANLLENALKHTPPDSPIEITARAVHGGVEIEIADRGPGLPAGAESRVFEKFFRGNSAASGAGLGLAICQSIVLAHKGSLAAHNRAGGGAVFRLFLPAPGTPPSLPVEPIEPQESEVQA